MIGVDIPTLSDFSKKYLHYVKEVKKKRSWSRDIYSLRNFLNVFKNKRLSEITAKDIDDYKGLRLVDVKPATVNRELQCIRHLFNLAKRWKMFFGENPVSESGLLEVNNQVERILTIEEEEKLLDLSPSQLKAIILIALNTGMRKSEILTLKWENIDFENNLINVNYLNSKSKKSRKIPINSKLRKLLIEQKLHSCGSEYVYINSNGTPYKRHDSVKGAFERTCRNAGIEGLRFHDLRHTAATRMMESNANIVAVKEILGHADIKTTMRYVHPDDSLKDAVEKLSNYALF